MKILLRLALGMDWISAKFGKLAGWAVLSATLISAGNALLRYGFDLSSNAWLEIQWYLFAATVMLGSPSCSNSMSMCGWTSSMASSNVTVQSMWIFSVWCFLAPRDGLADLVDLALFLEHVPGTGNVRQHRWADPLARRPADAARLWRHVLARAGRNCQAPGISGGHYAMDTHYENPCNKHWPPKDSPCKWKISRRSCSPAWL